MAKRRKNGKGLLRQRKDGRWEGRVVVGYDDKGLPKTKNVLAKTKTECAEKLEKLREEYRPPSTKCKPDMLFGDYIDFWYENFCKPAVRPLTQQNYENRIYDHIIPEIGKIPLNKLSQNDLQQFYARLKKTGRKIRKSGTGCVYQINDHLWEGSFYPRLPNGKRKKFNVYAETRDQCEAKLAEMITEKKAEIAEEKAK